MKLLLWLILFPILLAKRHDGIPKNLHERLKHAETFFNVMDNVLVLYDQEASTVGSRTAGHLGMLASPAKKTAGQVYMLASPARKLSNEHSKRLKKPRHDSDSVEESSTVEEEPSENQSNPSNIIKQGKDTCKLQSVCIPVPVESDSPQITMFPKCYEVKQCVGSCCDSIEKCHPHSVRNVEKPVVELLYVGNDTFIVHKRKFITVEEHTSCSCLECQSHAPRCGEGSVLGENCECEDAVEEEYMTKI